MFHEHANGYARIVEGRVDGIIFSPTTKVMVEPSLSSSTTYQLHEGSKAKITGENENWYEISFNDRKGWVEKIYLKKI